MNRTAFGVDSWVMDTRAGDHIVCSVSLFQSYTTVSHCVVELPNGELVHVTHIGIVKFSNSLILEHVFCVPSFSFNLLSRSTYSKIAFVSCVFVPILFHSGPFMLEDDWNG